LRNNHQFEVAGFIDSNPALHHRRMDGIKVLGDLSILEQFGQLRIGAVVIAIGDNRIRQAYAETCAKAGVSLVSAIDPSANIADTANIGKNVVIAAGTTICTHVTIGDSAICNTGCIIDHESVIHDGTHICPGVRLAGHVTVRPSAFVGIGATVIQGVTIGDAAVVGAGAVVLQDVPAYATVVGIPARVIKASHLSAAQPVTQASNLAGDNPTYYDPAGNDQAHSQTGNNQAQADRPLPARPRRIGPPVTPVLIEG